MMSFLVKGVDLPKDHEAIAIITKDGRASCRYGGDVIQIPKKHGRLIDAKLLADTINKAIQDGTFTSKSIWEWIGDAPTILEVEEE
jgi:hypothetical protein